jgi:20S proteasome alpha/beta subunit
MTTPLIPVGVLLLAYLAATTHAASAPWWQEERNRNSNRNQRQEDLEALGPNIFAPGGRLEFMNRVGRRMQHEEGGISAIVLHCKTGVVAVTTLPCSPYLKIDETTLLDHVRLGQLLLNETDAKCKTGTIPAWSSLSASSPSLLLEWEEIGVGPTTMPPFARLALTSSPVLAVFGGSAVDGPVLRDELLDLTETIRESEGDSIHIASLVRRFADQLQVRTQDDRREGVLAACAVVFDTDTIWRVDPSGQFYQCHAVVCGMQSPTVERTLLEKLAELHGTNTDATAITTDNIQHVLSQLSEDEAIRIARDCLLHKEKDEKRPLLSNLHTLDDRPVRLRGIALSRSFVRSLSSNQIRNLDQAAPS